MEGVLILEHGGRDEKRGIGRVAMPHCDGLGLSHGHGAKTRLGQDECTAAIAIAAIYRIPKRLDHALRARCSLCFFFTCWVSEDERMTKSCICMNRTSG